MFVSHMWTDVAPPSVGSTMQTFDDQPPAKRARTNTEVLSPVRGATSRTRASVQGEEWCNASSVSQLQRAFLTRLDAEGCSTRLAVGECRLDDGVFAIDDVNPVERNFDLAGIRLGDLVGSY